MFIYCFFDRNLLSQLEDERMETEQRLEKMSREMENVYQTKVEEKLQKLQENKQNVKKISGFLFRLLILDFLFIAFKNRRNISSKCSTRRRKN